MVFSTDFNQLKEWMPLVMEGRTETDRVAAPQ
jgi:malate dehydrogenase (quinone)